MPTYDYECTNCGHTFEMMQSITARPKRTANQPCEGCGKKAPIRRLMGTGGAILFKGSGFYETDYRSDSYKKAAEAEKKSQSGGSDKGVSTTKDSGKSQSGDGASSKTDSEKKTASKNESSKSPSTSGSGKANTQD